MKPVDIYVRVSRVGGREGDSFISPADQERRCRAQLEADGYEVGEVFIDLDESGATQDRPAFTAAMQRVEAGESGGIAVLRLNRFGRTTRGVLDDVARIEEKGAVFLAVEEKLDTSTSVGRFVLRMFASLAELELDRIREGWAVTHEAMIGRGVQSGRPPIGYHKGPDKVLVPNEWADTVRQAFQDRARGAGWGELAKRFNELGVPTKSGGPWAANAIRKMIANRAYLGEARHGNLVQVGAHEPLVDEQTFRRANLRGRFTPRDRSDGPLLGGGMVRCSVCGAAMIRSTTKTSAGRRYEFMRCTTPGSGHPTIAYHVLQDYLITETLGRLELSDGEYVGAQVDPELSERLAIAIEEIETLENQLESGEISASAYARAITVAERERDTLREVLEIVPGEVVQVDRRAQEERDAARTILIALLEPELAARLPQEVPNARRLMKQTLGKVTVFPGRGPVEERVTIGERLG